eukprot:4959782-Pyramimonas_sp.AAC.1
MEEEKGEGGDGRKGRTLRSAARKSDPGQIWPLVRGLWGGARTPDTSVQDGAVATRAAPGGPQWARTK